MSTTIKEIVTVGEFGDYKLVFGYDGTKWRPILINSAGRTEISVSDPLNTIYDFVSGKHSLCVTRGGGKSSFIEEYGANQTNLIIIPGSAGLVLQVVGVYTATEAATGVISVDFVGGTQKLWRLYAAKYQSASEDDFVKKGAPGESVKLNTTTGDNAAFIIVNFRALLAVEADYNFLTVADFQENAGTGTATDPGNLNDNDTGTGTIWDALDEYVEVAFSKPFLLNKYRLYGSAQQFEDGYYKIQYFNLTTGVWTDLVTDIPTRTGTWSDWASCTAVVTTKIRVVATTLDTKLTMNIATEWEMKYEA